MQNIVNHSTVEGEITRRRFLKAVTGSLGALALGMGCSYVDSSRNKIKRPNIILILTDDQRWDTLGCAGNSIIRTPNMDWLAENGVRFENAFVTTPICAASRASIFTGLYERTHKYNFGTEPLSRNFSEINYPNLLHQAGYNTGFIGKFGIDVDDDVIAKMFDCYQNLDRNPYFKKIDGKLQHLTEITGDNALQFLRSSKKDRPFSLTIGFNAPHAEDNDPNQYFWPSACDDLYRSIHIPEAKLSDPAFFNALPGFMKTSLNRIRWKWRFDNSEKYQNMVKGYYRMISGVDLAIGNLINELKKLELLDSTIIIMIGDNGYFLGERGFAGKWLLHDPSIRVPLIIFDPQRGLKRRGLVFKQFALNIDIAPTILDLAGVSIPKGMQGSSLLTLFSVEPINWRKDIFCEHLYNHPKIPQSEGIRTARWKYIRYINHPEFKELYDLQNDIFEEHNLAKNCQYHQKLLELDQRCNQMIRKLSKGLK